MFDLDIYTTPQGWVGAEVSPEHIEVAKEQYLERQKRCRSAGMQEHFSPGDMSDEDRDTVKDHRWSGDLGEMLVKDYLEQRVYNHYWLAGVRESEYDPDFRINGHHIDVKTKRRKRIPLNENDYYETVCNDQFVLAKTREIVGFLFCDYAYEDGWVYLVGKMSYKQFDELKIWRAKGDVVNKCTISADSWDVPITSLTPPLRWQKAS